MGLGVRPACPVQSRKADMQPAGVTSVTQSLRIPFMIMIEIRKGTLAHLKEKEEKGAEVPRAMDDEAQVGFGGAAPEPPGLLEAVV